VLVVDRLTVALDGPRGEQPVIEDVSLHIGRGESVGLVGESGSGKTITALAVLGLLPPSARVRSGRVLLGGQDLIRLSERELGRVRGTQVAYVSQEPMVALDPCFTVGSQLVEPLRLHSGAGRTASRARALELLRLVGIPRPEAVARSHPHQLSGGMAQRVAIALALTGEPDLLVADEPTTALDVTVQAEILDLLHSLQGELGMSLLLVTHDLAVVADLCDRVAVMYAGEIVELGAAEEVLLRPAHPYTRALLDATPRPAAGRPLRIVEGSVPGPGRRAAWCRFADRCGHVTDTCRSGPVPLLPPGPPAPPDGTRAEQLSRCLRSAEILERNPR
jgi:peptide/nickel transport system permease protein